MTTLAVRLPDKEERQNAIDLERLAEHLSACHDMETRHDFLEALEDFQSTYDQTITLRRGEN